VLNTGTLSFNGLTDSGTQQTPPVTTDNIFTLSLANNDSGTTVVYERSLNGANYITLPNNDQTGLADGDYRYRALVTDVAGNQATTNIIEVVVELKRPMSRSR
jgi:Bacterial Ig-like domain